MIMTFECNYKYEHIIRIHCEHLHIIACNFYSFRWYFLLCFPPLSLPCHLAVLTCLQNSKNSLSLPFWLFSLHKWRYWDLGETCIVTTNQNVVARATSRTSDKHKSGLQMQSRDEWIRSSWFPSGKAWGITSGAHPQGEVLHMTVDVVARAWGSWATPRKPKAAFPFTFLQSQTIPPIGQLDLMLPV